MKGEGTRVLWRFLRGEKPGKAERAVPEKTVEEWCERLMDISGFMRVLNESIARQASVAASFGKAFFITSIARRICACRLYGLC